MLNWKHKYCCMRFIWYARKVKGNPPKRILLGSCVLWSSFFFRYPSTFLIFSSTVSLCASVRIVSTTESLPNRWEYMHLYGFSLLTVGIFHFVVFVPLPILIEYEVKANSAVLESHFPHEANQQTNKSKFPLQISIDSGNSKCLHNRNKISSSSWNYKWHQLPSSGK